MTARVVLVPGVLALLPEYAGLEDPVAELRAACLAAVSWLTRGRRDRRRTRRAGGWPSICSPRRATSAGRARPTSYLVVGNGSACRTEKAPGHLDERAHGFDEALGRALRTSDPAALAAIDQALAQDLSASTEAITRLGEILTPQHEATVDYDDDPFGVQYWVLRWEPARQPA